MRIKKLKISNFRSIIDSGEISLDKKITILLGKNEQGKTNFLKAIESFRKDYEYQEDDLSYLLLSYEGKSESEIPIITLWFELDENEKTVLKSIDESLGKYDELIITKYFDGHYEIEKPDTSKILLLKIGEIKSSILDHFRENENVLKQSINYLNKIDKTKHIAWLKSLQRSDGGFSHIPGQTSHITNTHFAVKALMELEALDQIDKNNVVQFVVSCEHPNGGFSPRPNQQPQVQYTYNAILLLKELGRYSITSYYKYLEEFEKTADPTKIDKILNDIIDSHLINGEFINQIKNGLENLKTITENNIQKKILSLIPSFVYFDSVDFIGDFISIDEYLNNRERFKTFKNLFELAKLDVEKVKNVSNMHRRKLLFRNASTKITGMINEFWRQEEITVNLDIDGNNILVFVEDNLGAKADPPSRRSDGFRWFLSFYINFMAETKGELSNAVILLDNPGWLLHPSGQKDLLRALEEIAKTNQIIFTTHSPFLIDKNKLERIRIVERTENGTKIYEKFWDSIYDSLYVIRASIGADISDSLFGHKNNIIVEGHSDKIYLETLSNYLREKGKEAIDMSKVMIIGVGGADKIPYLLAWCKAEKYNSLAIVDGDDKGKNIVKKIKNMNMDVDEDSDILMLNEISEEFKGKDVEIEDLFNEEFYHMAVNRAYKEIFESKLGKPEIKLEDIPTNGLRTKRYNRFFKDKNLGRFDKIKVALEIKKMLLEEIKTETEDNIGETVDIFEKLFGKIREKFQKKGIKL